MLRKMVAQKTGEKQRMPSRNKQTEENNRNMENPTDSKPLGVAVLVTQ